MMSLVHMSFRHAQFEMKIKVDTKEDKEIYSTISAHRE